MAASPGPDGAVSLLILATALLCPSPLSYLLKERLVMFQNPLLLLQALGAAAALSVAVAEDALGPGTGPEKRARVIADLREQLPALVASLGLPAALAGVFASEFLLGLLVDGVVAAANQLKLLVMPKLAAA